MNKPKIVEVPLPEYTIESKPNYIELGKKVDEVIESNFPDSYYFERVLSIEDHPDLDIDDLVDIIVNTGTDRYDPGRKSVCHEEFEIYDYDLHLGSFEIKDRKIQIYEDDEQPTLFGNAIYNFYEHTPRDRGKKLRIDLMVLYDPDCFEQAKKFPEHKSKPEHKFDKYLYKFKEGLDRRYAVVGVAKVLR